MSYPEDMNAIALLFCLVGLFYILSSRRAARIERLLAQLTEGKEPTHSGVRGPDLIGRIGKRLDAAVTRLVEERAQLLASEERLKIALQGCDIGIWDWHLDNSHVYYSTRWKSLLGYTEDEGPDHAEIWLKRVHPDDLAKVSAAIDEHLSGRSELFLYEHRLRHKNGGYLWVQQSGVAHRDPEGRVIRMIGAMMNISRRKQTEAELLQSREAYRSAVDGVTEIIFRTDVDGRLTFLNPAWQELTGHTDEDTLGMTLTSLVHDEDRRAVRRFFLELTTSLPGDLACTLRLRCSDESWRWFSLRLRVNVTSEIPLVAGVLSDISAQKASEAALLRSNRERDAILTLGPDGFIFADKHDTINFVNPAFVAMTGLPAAEAVGKSLTELEQRLSHLNGTALGLATDDESMEGTMQLSHPRKQVVFWLARVLYEAGGEIDGRVVYLRDITRESEVDRMKSDFLSTAAHELRTPMASIFGFAELLLSREFEPEMQRDLLQRIHRQTKILINMINELLDLSRIEARGGKNFHLQIQDITPVVLNAMAAQYVPTESHTLEFDWPKNTPKVNVDTEKLMQCITNVLGNAFKYSPAGGVVRLSATQRGEPAIPGLA